jgi:carboxyl-terminal processing protease
MSERGRIRIVALSTCMALLVLIGALLGQDKSSDEPYRPLGVLSEVLSRIQTDYVEEPGFPLVTEGALHGLVQSLDPFSSYLSPEIYQEYQKGPRGDASIGAVIFKRGGVAGTGILAVVPGGPADRAGFVPGDILEAVDGQSTQIMSYAEVTASLQGPPGSVVTLTMVRESAPDPAPYELTREIIRLPDVEARILEPGIGYLKVQALPEGEAQEIAGKIDELRRQGATELILDLRENAIGEMNEGVETANLFIRRGLLAYVEGQQYPRQSFVADESKFLADEPLAVLVNSSTGGAAEIVAAAMIDNRRGDVVGSRTFGMASIQKTIPLEDGSALILSVGKYYSPSGRQIQEGGVTPTEVVLQDRDMLSDSESESEEGEENPEDAAPMPAEPRPTDPAEDEQLNRAIELLKAKAALPQAA